MAANVPERAMYKLFREAFTCATMLDWLTIITLGNVTKNRVEHWNGSFPWWCGALRTWGEAGVMKTKTKTIPKMKPRGVTSMMMYFKHQQPEVELSVNSKEISSEVRERDAHNTSTDSMDKDSKPGDAEDLNAGMEIEADDEAGKEIKPIEEAKEETVSDGEWEEFKQ
eukprot:12850753-Ditylum_brightwellii.AAC.1